MKKRKTISQRLLALMLCLLCLLAAMPIAALADDGTEPTAVTETVELPPESSEASEPASEPGESGEPTGEPTETSEPDEPTEAVTEPSAPGHNGDCVDGCTVEGCPCACHLTDPTEETETPAETTEPTGEPETTEETEGTAETTEATEPEDPVDPVQELYDRLMECTTLEEINAILYPETEEEQAAVDALIEQFTEEQNAALEAKLEELGAYGVDLDANDSQNITISSIAAGNYYTVFKGWAGGEKDPNGQNKLMDRGLSLDAPAGFTVEAWKRSYDNSWQGYKLWVANSVSAGTYTVNVSYIGGQNATLPNQMDTLTVTVINNNVPAGVYYLLSPNYNPASNATGIWGSGLGKGTIDKRPSSGATYTYSSSLGYDKNNFSPDQFILTMPTGLEKQTDGSYKLDKSTFPTQWNAIWSAYKSQWESENDGVTLNEEDVVDIFIKPYKLSQADADTRKEGSDPDHIDCTVSVKLKNIYGVRFYVTKPGEEIALIDSTSYKTDEKIQKTTKAPGDEAGIYPETLDVNGVTYKFDGWYNEAGEKVSDNSWPYSPNDSELLDGFVDFYAKYVPATYTLTITKQISGNMLSKNDSFTFTVSGNSVADQPTEFTLKDGESKQITVTIGDNIEVKEATGNYSTTYQVGNGTVTNGNSATITIESNQTITFTNTYNVTISTGISLETLPYILILAVVAVGAVVMVRKRRSRDED